MSLKFQTYTIVAGTAYCNARCFFCVSKMTTDDERVKELSDKTVEVDWRNFHKASRLAQISDVTTVLISGKGEPTMYPEEITAYLKELQTYRFPLIELQTNGTLFQHSLYSGGLNAGAEKNHLQDWYDNGLNTIILSIVSLEPEQNRRVYLPYKSEYPSLEKTIDILHTKGFSVRLGTIGLKEHIDTPEKLEELIKYCKKYGVEQLTWRPVNKAGNTVNPEVNREIEQSELTGQQKNAIQEYVEKNGNLLLNLIHGARVYDLHGQNICLTHSLTRDPSGDEVRQLIFYSTGEVMYDWEYPGAIILGKGPAARRHEREEREEKGLIPISGVTGGMKNGRT